MIYDYVIVGAGFAGCVMAERLASQDGKRCLIVERRGHIGGNAFDSFDAHGVLTHNYGPHYFRTNSMDIVNYLGQFTDWRHVEYKIVVWTAGRFWQFPINLNTFEQLLGRASSTSEMESTLAKWRTPIDSPKNSEEMITSKIGVPLYEMFYKNYTRKQWGIDASQLAPSVCGRIPIRTDRDNRYLSELFQALPKAGYHAMFRRMIHHDRIAVLLNTDYRTALPHFRFKHLIFTGPIDEFYEHCFGKLPYRSLKFEPEHVEREFFQPVLQINYPNDFDFTRCVEIKHATGQKIPVTTIIREYPRQHYNGAEPFYPIPTTENNRLYHKYAERASLEKNVTFLGRLASYRYYNMDQVVGMALAKWKQIHNHNHAAN